MAAAYCAIRIILKQYRFLHNTAILKDASMQPNRLCLTALIAGIAFSGCANPSPAPNTPEFIRATKALPAARHAIYTTSGNWYPNTLLGSVESFHAPSTYGRLLIGSDQLTFAIYDETTNTLLQAYQVSRNDVQWLTIKDHGLVRIARLQAGNTVNSFTFGDGENMAGITISKDALATFLRQNYNKQ